MLTLAPTNPDFKIKGVERRKHESVSPYPLFRTARIHKSSFLLKRKRCTVPLKLLQAIPLLLDPLEACASAEKSRPMLSTAVAICFWWSCRGSKRVQRALAAFRAWMPTLLCLPLFMVESNQGYTGEYQVRGVRSHIPVRAHTHTHTHTPVATLDPVPTLKGDQYPAVSVCRGALMSESHIPA